VLRGARSPARKWDLHVMLADAFGWSQQEVDGMDPEFAEEVLAFLLAKKQHEQMEARRRKRET
jgi:hypothetical protein